MPSNYRVTGVVADGRCLFKAIAHMTCLRKGEEVFDENHDRELANELRAQVVEELLKRWKEVEWFIDEDFDIYVKRIEQPYVLGGEPELLMSSYILWYEVSVRNNYEVENMIVEMLIKVGRKRGEALKTFCMWLKECSLIGAIFLPLLLLIVRKYLLNKNPKPLTLKP